MGPQARLLGNLEIPLDANASDSVVRLLAGLCAQRDVDAAGLPSFLIAVGDLVRRLAALQAASPQPVPFLTVRTFESTSGLHAFLTHRGIPDFAFDAPSHTAQSAGAQRGQATPQRPFLFLSQSRGVDGCVYAYFLARSGAGVEDADEALHEALLSHEGRGDASGLVEVSTPTLEPDGNIHIREIGAEAMPDLARLFYHVYGYSYVNSNVYSPEWLQRRLAEGDLRSYGALDESGRLLGHIGLLRHGAAKDIYEPCMGVTDPRVKSKGLFSAIFAHVMEEVERIPMRMSVFDCVTNIDFSQRLIVKHAGVETALFVGCQSKATQAKLSHLGLGPDPESMERYSLLMLVRAPRGKTAFDGPIRLPSSLGAPLEPVLEALGLDWEPASRCDVLPTGGAFEHVQDSRQQSSHFYLDVPGGEAVRALVERKRELFRSGERYCSVDLPVDARGLGATHDWLAQNGFFLAGLVPYRMSAAAGVRLQSLAPTRVGFPHIKVHSPLARRLLEVVRRDYERQEGIP